ncbi:hypothetical protein QC763_0026910 [Podospora pseudopauciseta]|uniref:Uncharacterized protein n=2 Tax=Podospora TaxID=5144 RepID=A0ABR0I2T0_9PEZI|nr:hypothetical protein QC763_0026910 [Podospora pseudopauciseta]KAK4683183.1 hypothetical protein QC764_0026810 [Podospora pseudoanserina]
MLAAGYFSRRPEKRRLLPVRLYDSGTQVDGPLFEFTKYGKGAWMMPSERPMHQTSPGLTEC